MDCNRYLLRNWAKLAVQQATNGRLPDELRIGTCDANRRCDRCFGRHPGVIGHLVIRSCNYDWHHFKKKVLVAGSTPAVRYALWDGGVYDNLGVEALFNPGGRFRDGFDFLVVSDASAPLSLDDDRVKRTLMPWCRTVRLVDVATEQSRGLRARSVVAEFQRCPEAGVYVRCGNTVDAVYRAMCRKALEGLRLSEVAVNRAKRFKTTLRRLSEEEFELLMRHGFEVANATLATRQPDRFSYREAQARGTRK